MFRVAAAFSHITLFQAERGDSPAHAFEREVTVAFHLERLRFILPADCDRGMHPRRMSLEADETPVGRFRRCGQAGVDAGGFAVLRRKTEFFNGSERRLPLPERLHPDRRPFARFQPVEAENPFQFRQRRLFPFRKASEILEGELSDLLRNLHESVLSHCDCPFPVPSMAFMIRKNSFRLSCGRSCEVIAWDNRPPERRESVLSL
ncbi:hypothetical protein SDC9_158812 [bioreactor metagenome]|uniref:Uncharacterized protein n=1 Tax=bioreactor metagenome TaxID=1076179 RepID=A0A645FDT4_9ZZZZ